MNRSRKKISIIGSGVSGLSCALVLQSLGFDITIYSKNITTPGNPMEVSFFPSASIIPHSVVHPNLTRLFKDSQFFFEHLYHNKFKGLTTHRHFELFGAKTGIPEYVSQMARNMVLDSFTSIPIKSNLEFQTGWEYECFFADWPIYFPELLSRFKQKGGSIILKELTREDIENLDGEAIINCSEFGSPGLFEEEFNPIIYRGHLLFIKGAPSLKDGEGKTISYNITPGSNFYSTSNGDTQDVYVYPRKDGWIIGGSRQKGTVNIDKEWIGEETIDPIATLEGVSYPKQILTLNRSVILQSFGIDMDEYKERELRIGYRFMGNGKEELKLASEEKFNRLVVHNYGHGGAGVTISWGCAFKVASIIIQKLESTELTKEAILQGFMN